MGEPDFMNFRITNGPKDVSSSKKRGNAKALPQPNKWNQIDWFAFVKGKYFVFKITKFVISCKNYISFNILLPQTFSIEYYLIMNC